MDSNNDSGEDLSFHIEYMRGILWAKNCTKRLGEWMGVESMLAQVQMNDPLLKNPFYQGINEFRKTAEMYLGKGSR